MGRGYTLNSAIETVKSIHKGIYNYSLVKTYKTIFDYWEIICKKHGVFRMQFVNHKRGRGCWKCNHKKFTDNRKYKASLVYIDKANKIHNNKYIYDKTIYKGSHCKIIVTCPTHGDFTMQARQHISKNNGSCHECSMESKLQKSIFPLDKYLEEVIKTHKNKYDYSKVIWRGTDKNIIIGCPRHGYFEMQAIGHRKRGCHKCNKEEGFLRPTKLNTNEFIRRHKSYHGENTYDYTHTLYINKKFPVIITCKIHGDFKMNEPKTERGCRRCCFKSHSKKALRWIKYVSIINNCYIRDNSNEGEYHIPKTLYRADGYCKDTNTIYEFYGTVYHGDPRYTDHTKHSFFNIPYKELYERTLKKENKIKELGYNLVSIWEAEWDKIEKLIKFIQRRYRKKLKTRPICYNNIIIRFKDN